MHTTYIKVSKEIIIIILVTSEYLAFMLFVLVLKMIQNLWHDLWVTKKIYPGSLGKYKFPSNLLI